MKNEWISVKDRLPEIDKFRMSKDVLTIAGSKMAVRCYDFELNKWSAGNYITITHWMPLPPSPSEDKEKEPKCNHVYVIDGSKTFTSEICCICGMSKPIEYFK